MDEDFALLSDNNAGRTLNTCRNNLSFTSISDRTEDDDESVLVEIQTSFPTSIGYDLDEDEDDKASNVIKSKEGATATTYYSPTTTCEYSSLPPLPTQAVILCLLAVAIRNLPSNESLDEYAKLETFTNVYFEDYVSLPMITVFRLVMATIMLGQGATVFLWGCWEFDTVYHGTSKLTSATSVKMRGALHPEGNLSSGLKCISFFTLWCWLLEGTSFLVNGMIPLLHLVAPEQAQALLLSPWVYRSALVLWHAAAPASILVSAVVTYVLWPLALQQKGDTRRKLLRSLSSRGALMQHNLNSVAALVEVGLLGRLPVLMNNVAIPLLYGIVYLIFSYSMAYSWADDQRKGPQYIYPVLDTTLGAKVCSGVILAFVAALSTSTYIFSGAFEVLPPFLAVPVFCIALCRFPCKFGIVCREKMTTKTKTGLNIAYSLAGEGRGHTVRAIAMAERLQNEGHNIKFFTSRDSLDLLIEKFGKDAIISMETPDLVLNKDGSVNALFSFLKTWKFLYITMPSRVRRVVQQVTGTGNDGFKADVLMTDFEPTFTHVARKTGLPLISFDSQRFMLDAQLNGKLSYLLRLKLLPVTMAIVFKFLPNPTCTIVSKGMGLQAKPNRPNTIMVGPMLRSEFTPGAWYPKGTHVIAYLRKAALFALEAAAQHAKKHGLVLRLYGHKPEVLPDNVIACPISNEGFIRDVLSAEWIVQTAGSQLLGEVSVIGIPSLVIPEKGQFEQETNISLCASRYGNIVRLPNYPSNDFNVDLLEMKLIESRKGSVPAKYENGIDAAFDNIQGMLNKWSGTPYKRNPLDDFLAHSLIFDFLYFVIKELFISIFFWDELVPWMRRLSTLMSYRPPRHDNMLT